MLDSTSREHRLELGRVDVEVDGGTRDDVRTSENGETVTVFKGAGGRRERSRNGRYRSGRERQTRRQGGEGKKGREGR